MATEQLTLREAEALEHLRKAEDLEVSLAEYCRSFELDLKGLYATKQTLVKKGALPGKALNFDEDKLSDFVAVTVAPAARSVPEPVCRIRHPSGLLIECLSWPSADWMGQLCGAARVPA